LDHERLAVRFMVDALGHAHRGRVVEVHAPGVDKAVVTSNIGQVDVDAILVRRDNSRLPASAVLLSVNLQAVVAVAEHCVWTLGKATARDSATYTCRGKLR
jgi:hypothetical protein